MSSSHGIIATVCARGGSKGLPGKNIRPFAERPLIAHTILQALACTAISDVYVSTDDEKIAEVARSVGARVPFIRPPELASDHAPKLPVVEHLVSWVETHEREVSHIIDLQPTSPLREKSDIEAALARAPNAQLVISVSRAKDNPYFNLVEQRDSQLVYLCKGNGEVRRQDAPAVYALNGSIYVWKRYALAHACVHGMWSVPMTPYIMPRWKSIDIDDLDDFELALWMHERHAAPSTR
jgi:CMP-N,N'-diacetyllegionaminic acid synthase